MLGILFILVSFASFAGIIITPALPYIVSDLGISESAAQYLLSAYLFGYAIGIPFYGPIANRFGRKKTLFFGLGLAFFGTFVCLSSHFALLIIGRILQALGAAGVYKIVFTIVGDVYEEKQAYKALALIMLSFGPAPGMANLLGGYLTEFFTWHSCFVFLLLYTIFLGILSCYLPETSRLFDPHAFRWRKIMDNFWYQFKNKPLLLNGIILGFSTAMTYVFAAQAPFISINGMGIKPDTYGLLNMIPSLGLVAGLLLARKITEQVLPRTIVLLGIGILTIGSVALGFISSSFWLVILLFFIFFALIQFGNGFIVTVCPAQALSQAKDKSYGAAVLQFINMGLTTISTWTIGSSIPKNSLSLAIAFCVFAFVMFIAWYMLNRKQSLKHS